MSKPERLRDSTTQGIANVMWSFATLRFYPARFMTAACVALEHRLQHCNDQELSNCLWAVARLAHHPGPNLMIRFCEALDTLVLLCPLLFHVPFWGPRLCAQAYTHTPSTWCNLDDRLFYDALWYLWHHTRNIMLSSSRCNEQSSVHFALVPTLLPCIALHCIA